jgi:multiple sugar transport system ATP-binding protein
MATVTLRDVSKVFDGKVVAVNKFNLEINDREFIVFVGPSGCGKTTTLRMVSGLEEITAGEIAIDNVIVNDIPPKDREIAMVFQNYALYPHMSVYKNLAFGLKLRKYPKEEIDKRVKEAADILEIHDLLGRKPKELSGGQMQRVALGRAIVRNAKVYLLDEPLSNLDAKLRVEMRAELNRLHTRLQATMIYVTHDQVEAMTLGDRIVIMLDGLIQQVDTPINIYDYPVNKFVGSFIGSPPMNFINGTVIKDNGDLAFLFTDGQNKIRIPERIHKKVDSYIDKEVYLGVRPEAIFDANYHAVSEERRPNYDRLKGSVEVIERLGNEMVVYLKVGDQIIIFKENAHYKAETDAKKEVMINLERIHIFDKDSEMNLTLD